MAQHTVPGFERNTVLSWSKEPSTGPSLLSHVEKTWTVHRMGSCLSFRDDNHVPQDLVPRWRHRGESERYPTNGGTCAKGPEEGYYLCSQISGAAIPQLPPLKEFRERLRIDFRFGPLDHMLYAQFWKESAPHLAWIERVETHRQLYQGNVVGYVIQLGDWTPTYEGGPFGKLCSRVLERLREAFLTIYLLCIPLLGGVRTRQSLARIDEIVADCTQLLSDLDVLAATYRETAVSFTRIQRGIAELRGFRLFRLDVQHHVGDDMFVSDRMFDTVGVFTLDTKMYDLLYRLGIPVWLVVKQLPARVRSSDVVSAIPWARSVETTPLDSTPYTLDSHGRKHRNRYDMSPPRYGPERQPAQTERDVRRLPAPRVPETRGRSTSPRRETSRAGGSGGSRGGRAVHERGSRAEILPRHVLHEDRRAKGGATHPDAPRAWVKRSCITDPGFQADDNASRPAWIPDWPEWLRGVAASVDRGVEREWYLCAAAEAVPQGIFLEKQIHALPPFHLFIKSENRLRFMFPMWTAFRNFWFGRVLREECDGLETSLWRKILDGKYVMEPGVLEWIRARAPKSEAGRPEHEQSQGSQRSSTAMAQHTDNDVSMEQDAGDLEGADAAEATRERVRVLREQIEAALEHDVRAAFEHDDEGDESGEHEAGRNNDDEEEEEEGEIGPSGDPVYGLYEPPKSGYDLDDFVVHRKRVDRSALAKEDVRAFLIWEIQEASFRFQVRQLDRHVLKSSKQWTSAVEKERRALWPKIWGGLDGFVPSGVKMPGQTHPDPRVRLPCVYHLWKMVSSWPRCSEVPNLRHRTVNNGLNLAELGDMEQAVWKFYAQTFFDYFGYLPMIPTCMPPNPFVE